MGQDVDLSNPDVKAIVQIAADFAKALEDEDLDTVVGFYSPDVMKMSPGGPTQIGNEGVKQSWQKYMTEFRGRLSVRFEEVTIFGDFAYDRATYTLISTPKAGGDSIVTKGRVSEIVRKEGGAWKSFRVLVNVDEGPPRK